MLSGIRKKIGRAKCVVLDQWPYRGRVRGIPAARAALRPLLESLPPLPRDGVCDYEIHMLCGRRDLDMGIWASWSMMRFMGGRAGLIVHSDGSLGQDDAGLWRQIVGNVTVVERAEADAVVHSALAASHPRLHAWRCANWASAQLVDVHFFGSSRQVLVMDSDVLTFARPDGLIEGLSRSEPCFRWCRDLRESYSASPALLAEITGVKPVERLCAGLLVSPRLGPADFATLEEMLSSIARDGRADPGHFWSCQTYYALLAAKVADAAMLPASYDNTGGATGTGQVLRHYVGIPRVRFRYFSEGLPRILSQKAVAQAGPGNRAS